MATNNTPTINVISAVYAATAAATVTGNEEIATIAKAARPHLKGASLVTCCATFIAGEKGQRAIEGGKQEAVNRATALLVKLDVDTDDTKAVRDALWPSYWLAAGNVGEPAKGDTDAEKTAYNTLYVAAYRMAKRITGEDASDKAAVRVSKALQVQIDTLHAAIATLKAEHGAAQVNEAFSRAAKASRKAK